MFLHCGHRNKCLFCFVFQMKLSAMLKNSFNPAAMRTDCGGNPCICVTLGEAAVPPQGCY